MGPPGARLAGTAGEALPVRCVSDERSRDEALRIARLADPAKAKVWEAAAAEGRR